MNITANNNSTFNLSLRKEKESKRPTFSTVFDKLEAKTKKLNSRNPINAEMTNEQLYRYYLQDTEPLLHVNNDTFNTDDFMGDKSLRDMKLSDFVKLLSGDLERPPPLLGGDYESIPANIFSSSAVMPSLISTPPPLAPPPPPPPLAPPISLIAPPPPPPLAPPTPPTPPATAPPLVPPLAPPTVTLPTAAAPPTPTAAAPPTPTAAAPPTPTATTPTPTATTPTPAAGGGLGAFLGSMIGLGPSAPPSGAVSGASTAPSIPSSTVVPSSLTVTIPKPAITTPLVSPSAGGGGGGGAASGAASAASSAGVSPATPISPSTAPLPPVTSTPELGNYTTKVFQDAFKNSTDLLTASILPPNIGKPPIMKPEMKAFSGKNQNWQKLLLDMNEWNEKVKTSPAADKAAGALFKFTGGQQKTLKGIREAKGDLKEYNKDVDKFNKAGEKKPNF